jgi:hypothetical protein
VICLDLWQIVLLCFGLPVCVWLLCLEVKAGQIRFSGSID